ncbi:MAG: IS110 family transposase [Lutibacter sp.]|jgi:transposase|nr:IS110 family transposase [Lutibacter sp.]
MDKVTSKQVVGIDVSKDTFDVYSKESGHAQFSNDTEGFNAFTGTLGKDQRCVMESTGSYHQRLALYLFERGFTVSIVNPLSIRRYIEMKLVHVKTDRSDACWICSYGVEQSEDLRVWQPSKDYVEQCGALITVSMLYHKQSTALKNKLHSLQSRGHTKGAAVRSLKLQLKRTRAELEKLEGEMEQLIKEHEGELFTHITSIPGIGRKTAMFLIAITQGFEGFESHRQVVSYLGLAPTERTSGSSVRGTRRISKAGNPAVRNRLFMCSFTACMYNPQCRALYERLVAKGKSKKLALIAVCNKLLKQAFAVARSGMPYDPHYRV